MSSRARRSFVGEHAAPDVVGESTSQVAHRLRVGLALAIFWSYRRGPGLLGMRTWVSAMVCSLLFNCRLSFPPWPGHPT
jgi:hypothetical protein